MADDLVEALRIKDWCLFRHHGHLLAAGEVIGDPRSENSLILTSPLIYIDPEGRWVPSQNTLYALGQPSDPLEMPRQAGGQVIRPGLEEAIARL